MGEIRYRDSHHGCITARGSKMFSDPDPLNTCLRFCIKLFIMCAVCAVCNFLLISFQFCRNLLCIWQSISKSCLPGIFRKYLSPFLSGFSPKVPCYKTFLWGLEPCKSFYPNLLSFKGSHRVNIRKSLALAQVTSVKARSVHLVVKQIL